MKVFAFASRFVILTLLAAPVAFAQESSDANAVPVARYFDVAPGISRGARPDLEGLKFLARKGVRYILNLENDPAQAAWERAEAAKLGIHTIASPMSGFWRPKDRQVQGALAVLDDPSVYPVFVHCQHGQDRTGLIVSLHRVFSQGWQPAVAYAEMRQKGFHSLLFMLDQYFIDATGYSPYPPPTHDE